MKQRLLTILPLVVVVTIGAVLLWVLFGDELTSGDEVALEGDAATSEISGRVIDTRGRPIAGANVFAEEAMTRTDGEGRFSFDELPAESVRVDATAEGYRRGGVDELGRPALDLSDGEPVEDLELVLARAATLSGRVVAGGDPVENAEINLSYVFAEGLQGKTLEPYIVSRVATSGEDGAFSVPEIAPGRLQILVDSEEYSFAESDDLYFRPGQSRDDVIVDLAPSGRLVGRIATDDDEPVAAEVRLTPLDTQGTSWRTDTAQERFGFDDLTEGRYSLRVQAEDYRTVDIDELYVAADDTVDVEVELERSRGLYGRVIEPDGTPVENAHVIVEGEEETRRLRTDPRGRFEWEEVSPGNWRGIASSPGHQPSAQRRLRLDEETVFEVVPGGIVEGRVVDPDGRPVDRFDVEVATMELDDTTGYQARHMPSERVDTPRDGLFEIGPLQSGKYRFLVTTDEYAPATTDAVDVRAGSTTGPITVQLEGGGAIEGIVTDAVSGEPIVGAEVRLAMRTPDNRPPRTRTDQRGYYELTDLPSGRSSLRIAHGHYIFELIGGLHIPDGGTLTHDVELEPIDERGQPGQNLQGIGASLSSHDDGFRVEGVSDDAPAGAAGIDEGDVITAVDGESVDRMTIDQVVELIRGEPGTAVTLQIDRPGRGTRSIDVERDTVFMPQDRPVRPRE